MDPDDERARGFGIEGEDESDDLRGRDESRTLGYRMARAALASLPGGELLATLVDFERERQVRTALDLVNRVTERTGEEALLARVRGSQEISAAFRQAMEAATRTGHETKRRALPHIIVAAVLDDARIDESALLVSALRDLDEPHLRTLEAMRRAGEKIESKVAARGVDTRVGPGPSLAERFENSVIAQIKADTSSVPSVVVVALARAGVIEPRGTIASIPATRPEHHRVSGFGHRLLDYVRDEAAASGG